MHSIKDIRKNFENFKKLIKLRNVNLDFDNILFLDEKNRNLIQEKESLEMEKKNISKNKDEKLFAKSKEISSKIDNLSNQQSLIKNQLNDILSLIPNIPLEDVPHGTDEKDNKEIQKNLILNQNLIMKLVKN